MKKLNGETMRSLGGLLICTFFISVVARAESSYVDPFNGKPLVYPGPGYNLESETYRNTMLNPNPLSYKSGTYFHTAVYPDGSVYFSAGNHKTPGSTIDLKGIPPTDTYGLPVPHGGPPNGGHAIVGFAGAEAHGGYVSERALYGGFTLDEYGKPQFHYTSNSNHPMTGGRTLTPAQQEAFREATEAAIRHHAASGNPNTFMRPNDTGIDLGNRTTPLRGVVSVGMAALNPEGAVLDYAVTKTLPPTLAAGYVRYANPAGVIAAVMAPTTLGNEDGALERAKKLKELQRELGQDPMRKNSEGVWVPVSISTLPPEEMAEYLRQATERANSQQFHVLEQISKMLEEN